MLSTYMGGEHNGFIAPRRRNYLIGLNERAHGYSEFPR